MEIKKPKINTPSLKKPNIKAMNLPKPNITKQTLKNSTRSILILTKRDLINYFSSPLAYLNLALFVVIVGIIFFGIYQFLQFGTNDLTQLFTAVAFAFIIIIPALTMGAISKEKQSGTIEFILTQPVTELQFLVSKFLSNAVLLLVSLLLTLPLSLVINYLGGIDSGQVLMQYFGAFLIGLCFISIGIAVSSVLKSEIASLLVSILISVLFVITGSQMLNIFPLEVQGFVEKLSLLSHYQSISRGVLDIRDLFYFVSFIVAFFFIAYFSLVKTKFPNKSKYLKRANILLVSAVVFVFLVGSLGQYIPGRIDVTSTQKFTLSEQTRKVISEIPETLDVRLYASSNLPIEFQSLKRDVEDILRDYTNASGGKITYSSYDPTTDKAAKDTASSQGIQEVVFAVDSNDATQRVVGYLGVTFKYNDATDVINITSNSTNDLEYQISRRIKKLTTADKLDVAFVSNNVSQNRSSTYSYFGSELAELYDVTDLNLTKDTPTIPETVRVVIIPGPNSAFDSEVIQSLKDFYNKGGSIILFTDTINLSEETGTPEPNSASLASLFSDNGVTVDENFVYDLKQNNIIGIPSGSISIPVEYPLWFVANATNQTNEILKNVTNITELWGSSVSVDESKLGNSKLYRLFETTDNANAQSLSEVQITVDTSFSPKQSDSKRLVAVALQNENDGRAVVVGNSGFITNDLIDELKARKQGLDSLNMSFAIGSVEWAAADNQLSAIKARNTLPQRIAIEDQQRVLLIGGGLVLPISIVIGSGAFVLYRRRQLQKKQYEF